MTEGIICSSYQDPCTSTIKETWNIEPGFRVPMPIINVEYHMVIKVQLKKHGQDGIWACTAVLTDGLLQTHFPHAQNPLPLQTAVEFSLSKKAEILYYCYNCEYHMVFPIFE